MSKKTTTILIVAFAALVVIFFIQRYASRPSGEMKSLSELKINFDPRDVNIIKVFKQDYPDSGLQFVRKDTSWVVANEYNAAAKGGEVEKFLADLDSVTGAVRGESEELYPDFEITDKNALQIKLVDANNAEIIHVYVGKGGPDGKSCFVRLPGSPKVYLANNNFISRFAAWAAPPEKKLPTDRWMDLSMMPLKRDEISAIKLHTPKANYEFELITEPPADTTMPPIKTWQQVSPSKGTKLDEPKIRSLQSSVGGLSGNGVVNPEFGNQYSLDKPPYSIWASDALGNTVLIGFSDKIDTLDTRYATVQGRRTVYKINKWVFDRVFVTPFEKPKENKK